MRIGTAGWSVPSDLASEFPSEGSVLQRYAARFNAVEINSSFYRPHQLKTYTRWAASTPAGFRFAVKAPKAITHQARLVDCGEALAAFVDQVACLGDKLGPVLVQLPPSLTFNAAVAERFWAVLRGVFSGLVACEPRHASWFGAPADVMLEAYRIARVAADPALNAAAARPGGWGGLRYQRLHGSPRMYYSAYSDAMLGGIAASLHGDPAADLWCMFDNTAAGAAARDALSLQRLSATPNKIAERP